MASPAPTHLSAMRLPRSSAAFGIVWETGTVIDGPFAATNELVAGYWLWQVNDMEEAIEWIKRCPNPMPGRSEIELRPISGVEDFGDAMTQELAERERRQRAQLKGA